jgi:Tol biopolymer transport system component
MKKTLKFLCASFIISLNLTALHAAINPSYCLPDTGKNQTDATLFAPGIIPGVTNRVAAPAFSPDGRSVYFGQSADKKSITIMVSHRKANKWTEPVLAPFSGEFQNLEPAFSPNGKFLIFASSRPKTPGGPKLDGYWGKKTYPGNGGNLWKVELTKKGWGIPELLPEAINQNSSIFSPAVTADGSVYFMLPDTSGRFHIRRSQFKNGKYETPVRPSFSVDQYGDVDPAVAPDESFLIFSSGRPPALPHTADLFIVFLTPNGWSEPIDLRQAISDKVFGVEARLSPDLKTLYFSNQRNAAGVTVDTDQYIWQVDISKILKEHGL